MRFFTTQRAAFASAFALSIAPALAQGVTPVQIASGLTRPVFLTTSSADPGVLYVVQAPGQIVRLSKDGQVLSTFLNISAQVTGGTSGETGLLGLAFANHPDDPDDTFYVNYTTTINGMLHTSVDAFTFDTATHDNAVFQRNVYQLRQPFTNHNGGWLAFGPDRYLYVAVGDGGSANDPNNNAADLSRLWGKMLRLDVSDPGVPYAIPETNPFVGLEGVREEVWAYGLRNPWRCSFDRETGDLWIGDVGQDAREEINYQPASSLGGEHYGWRCREGNIATPGVTGCPETDPMWTEPVSVYIHGSSGRCSVTGGYVYRGCTLGESYYGKYFFGDFCSGEIFSFNPETRQRFVEANVPSLASFGEDENGELYALSLNGAVYRLSPTDPGPDANTDGVPDTCDCPAEFNSDGYLDLGDIVEFINAFLAEDPAADLNRDTIIDNDDISVFLESFLVTCAS